MHSFQVFSTTYKLKVGCPDTWKYEEIGCSVGDVMGDETPLEKPIVHRTSVAGQEWNRTAALPARPAGLDRGCGDGAQHTPTTSFGKGVTKERPQERGFFLKLITG